ncbi:MAG: tRNA (guanosine(37)-N1)-methyltransferase TrmD [Methylococcaceae bacterium]|nr:tRNA (guanosine(37)-N1)-methyltransferase TrmD [Methylococcaceae bacterium]MDZ4156672.1 tRNA (guanosine(37)-N1)-methyltransferase TrmD [Methylococcales bacterium]MDP2394822.1 tRNA (guanosine(37)-N1)-methyltransferase TrmD [Methylococcaceae bacterium]MDP3020243.1 tRNA (guanosine(37)-N1)-methyltransferase TrmD [Methylococcaceae bacterium]MDP3390784.1 tRNA (guanosine(37)-N1)-methyltransferase TrmD [Methylococcaceae bacterium]
MRFDVLTLFPELVFGAANYGVTGRAIERGIVSLNLWNPRDYALDVHRTVDDRPYGGGPGMVMKYQPLHDAITQAKKLSSGNKKVIYLSPQGKPITQALLSDASQLSQLILVAGRYEGIDERFVQLDCDEEWSLGDYVISGGELAALVVVDAITRLLPGVLGDADSADQDSHVDGLLDCPHFTRPEQLGGHSVPNVLLSGNHAEISRWRMKQSLGRTWQRRPDLLEKKQLTAEQEFLLKQFKNEVEVK